MLCNNKTTNIKLLPYLENLYIKRVNYMSIYSFIVNIYRSLSYKDKDEKRLKIWNIKLIILS